jgi:Holliday junction resolvasome RuvABC endonuclease subunit
MSDIYSIKEKANVDPIFIEGYGFSFRGMDFTLAELGGIIRLSLLECVDQSFYNVPPTSLKLFITGKGNSAKNIMLEQVYRRYKLGSEILKDDNQVDAYALARFGAEYMNWKEGKSDLPKRIVESFKKITGCEAIDCAEAYLK